MMKALGCLFLIGGTLSAQQVIEPRIVSETRPSGSLIQIKVDITSPRPIVTSGESARFESDWFDSVEGVSIYSPAGDAYGAAVVRNGLFTSRLVSPLGSLGTQLDYPFLMIATRIRAGLPTGAQYPLRLDATTFQAPDGSSYSVLPKEGTLTIGGAVSIFNVIPGGGVLPAGAVVRIIGTGFNEQTRVSFDETVLNNVRVISPTEINVTLGQSTQMSGREIRIRGQGNDEVIYYSYLRAAPVGSSTNALLNATHPMFPSQVWRSAGVKLPAVPAGSFAGLTLQNSTQTSASVQLELVSAAGLSLGATSVTMAGGTRYARTAQELFGAAAVAGSVIKVTASSDMQVMGLVGDEVAGVVSAFAAVAAPVVGTTPQLSASITSLSFEAQVGGVAPAARAVNLTSTTSAVLSFSAAANQPWLLVTPNGGSTPGSVSVAVNPAGLTAGTYTGAVTLTPPAPSTPVSVPVTFTVSTAPVTPQLSAALTSLSFEAQVGGTAPAARAVNLTSTTGAVLSFAAAANQSWLLVTPNSGSTPGSVSVSVNPAGLAAGTYNGTVTLTPPSPSTPVTIPVTFTITAAPVAPRLSASVTSLSFDALAGGSQTLAQTVFISSVTSVALTYTVNTNAPWLTATPSAGSTPGAINVSVNPATLTPGQLTGLVTVTPPAPATPINITVTVRVTGPPAGGGSGQPQLSASPSTLAFTAQGGAPAAQTRTLAVTSTHTNVTLSYTASSNVPWLSVSPAAGSTPGSLTVTANSLGLSPGVYSGSVSLAASSPASTVSVQVSLTVTDIATPPPPQPQLVATPSPLVFTHALGQSSPAPQSLRIENRATGAAPVAVSLRSNAGWLSLAPLQGVTPLTVTVRVLPNGVGPGTYDGAILVTAASGGEINVPVRLNVTQPGNSEPTAGTALVTAVVNAASQTPGVIAPGALVTIYGSGLGPANGQLGRVNTGGILESIVAGTRVWFGSFPAPVLFTSNTQVNTVVPFEVQGMSAVDVFVEYQGQRSAARSMTVIPSSPALFTMNAAGTGQAAALNQDFTVNSPATPARRGSVVVLYATGLGVLPGAQTGEVAGSVLLRPSAPVTVSLGGIPVEPLYAGSAPGLIHGVVQLNLLVPDHAPSGQPVAVQVTANGRPSQAGVTIAVE